jgi:predicted ester cyclase
MKKLYGISIALVVAIALVTGLLASCSGVKQADYDAAKAQVTSLQNQVNTLQGQVNTFNAAKTKADANKALVEQYVEQVINAHNPNAMDALVSPDYKRYPSATATLTLDDAKKRLGGLFAAFPDAHVTIDSIIAEGDLVMYRDTIRGTHQGTFQGIAPTDKQTTIAELITMRIENGKIVEHWGGPDLLSLLQQLGAVISAGK